MKIVGGAGEDTLRRFFEFESLFVVSQIEHVSESCAFSNVQTVQAHGEVMKARGKGEGGGEERGRGKELRMEKKLGRNPDIYLPETRVGITKYIY